MRTARCAGASISKPFDHEIAIRCNLLPERRWRWFGKGWLLVVLYLNTLSVQRRAQALHEQIAARFGDIKQAHR